MVAQPRTNRADEPNDIRGGLAGGNGWLIARPARVIVVVMDSPTHCVTAMNTRRNTSWLDTETKAMLQQVPPEKVAPATTETFSLVVLAFDTAGDHNRSVANGRIRAENNPDRGATFSFALPACPPNSPPA